MPIAFGYHPFFQLPGVPRAEWEITLPVAERLLLDERLVPTGERAPAGDLDGPLGDRTFDDGFTLDAGAGPFVLAGGGRRIEVAFERGYPLRADLRAGDRRRHLLRADDRAGRRAAPLAGRRGARRVVLRALQRVDLDVTKRCVRTLTNRVSASAPAMPVLTATNAACAGTCAYQRVESLPSGHFGSGFPGWRGPSPEALHGLGL